MSRLTRRAENGTAVYATPSGEPVKWENNRRKVLQKLAEYEDLEEQGLLLKLPCKLRDETYWIDDEDEDGNKGLCVKGKSYVEAIGVDKDGFLISTGDGSWDRPNKSRWCFLTKEEAEKELKRLECTE